MKALKTQLSRRRFLGAAASACAIPLFVKGSVLGRDGYVSPNNKLITSMIGVGHRGGETIGSFANNPQCHMIAVSDCYKAHLDTAADRVNGWYKNKDCKKFERYEDLLQLEEIDIVSIATPDHWHTKITVEACKAGKDVYCEKPLTYTLAEGLLIVEAARKYNRVCTSGSQRVMEDYGYMAPVIQSGAIGEVKEVFIEVGSAPKPCNLPEQPIPEGMDWDRWLGQAPLAPYHPERCSGNYGGGWRQYEEYCNGFLADWGAHKFGGALYALGLDKTDPVEIIPPNDKDVKFMTAVFANGIRFHHCPGTGYDITFVGTEREYKHGQRDLKPAKPVDVRRYHGGTTNILSDFLYCVKNRLRPFQDLEYGARTAAFCQLLHIAYKVNRPLKWDQANLRFIDDDQANRLVYHVPRSPYAVNLD
ncbi:MAG: Gfo/Idh/MocA family oxidoreductase [Planctomycetaceae bacterium]|jgi:predicted dehydrogenase|nr:Gfo/Idh/MocA family oxidoreductase [Planctomycetaceae bacterium]